MRINRLQIKNFKGFEERAFEFPRSIDVPGNGNGSFHLIIGQNGKGKTSVLDALAVAAGSWFLGVRGEDSRHIQHEDIRVRVLQYSDTARIEPQYPVIVEAEGIVTGEPISWKREFSGGKTSRVNAKRIKALGETAVRLMQAGEVVALPLISYFGTGRLWQEPKDMRAAYAIKSPTTTDPENVGGTEPQEREEEDLAASFASRLAGYRFSIDPRCSPKDLLRWLKFEQQLAVQDRQESNQFQVVKEAIRQAVENCNKVEYHLRLGLLLDIEGQPLLPFGALSDGQRNMIAMVGDLAFKAAQLNPHLGNEVLLRTPGVVLIDELDLHLHPLWQRHVIEDLRRIFPEVQFIVTTHSPFIVQTARDGEVIKLDGDVAIEPAGRTIEEVSRLIMDVKNTQLSPRHHTMLDTARKYLELVEQAKSALPDRREEIQRELVKMLAPFTDNPAYTALLERRGDIQPVTQ